MDFTTSYAAIIKADKNEDGTLTVYGKATDDAIDSDNQICDAGWLNKAMPDWFKTGGNIREQHSNIAAGVAKELETKADGHYISVLVVDPTSVKKVEAGVLKGFSIGIRAPRVVRDQKAANGRIIDGQIVEVSLVDRPANPNAKLIMAKSVEGESTLVKAEEWHEYKAPLPTELFKNTKTEKGSKMETIKQITELAKSLTPDTVKFDKNLFDTAIKAIADLIVVEAGEISADNSERDSIEHLLDALKHLRNWYEGEVEEGEVSAPELSSIDLAAEPETVKGDGCECDCADCAEEKGCDAKMCKCGNVSATEVKSADVDEPAVEAPAVEETPAQEVKADEEVSPVEPVEVLAEEKALVADDIASLIEKALAPIKAEVESLRSEKESVVEKATKLEEELAIVKSLPATGPKRTGAAQAPVTPNDDLMRAARLRAMAETVTDPFLAKGYRDRANDLINKASQANISEKDN